MRRFARALWKYVLPAAVATAIGWYFYDKLRRPELWTGQIQFKAEWLVPAALLYLCAHAVWGRFSVTLLRNQGATLSVATGLRAYFISQFGKYVPGKVWVIVLRVGMLGNIGISRTAVGITAMYETLVAMGAGALIGALLAHQLAPAQTGLQGMSVYWVLPFAFAPVGLVGLNRFVNRMSRWRKGPDAPQLPRVKLHLVLLGLMQASAGWLLLGVSLWMTVRGLHGGEWPLTGDGLVRLISINAIAYVIGFVAFFMPAGGGVREFALQTLLAIELRATMPAGEAEGLAAVTAIMLRSIWTAAELVAGGVLYQFARPAASQSPELSVAGVAHD